MRPVLRLRAPLHLAAHVGALRQALGARAGQPLPRPRGQRLTAGAGHDVRRLRVAAVAPVARGVPAGHHGLLPRRQAQRVHVRSAAAALPPRCRRAGAPWRLTASARRPPARAHRDFFLAFFSWVFSLPAAGLGLFARQFDKMDQWEGENLGPWARAPRRAAGSPAHFCAPTRRRAQYAAARLAALLRAASVIASFAPPRVRACVRACVPASDLLRWAAPSSAQKCLRIRR
jgi:hypothetical protein